MPGEGYGVEVRGDCYPSPGSGWRGEMLVESSQVASILQTPDT